MAIRYVKAARVTIDVPIEMLREDGGYDKGDLRVTYKMDDTPKFREIAERFGRGDMTPAQLLRDRITNVEGVLDADGNEREFTSALLEDMANDPDAGPALVNYWIRLQDRRDKEAEKN